MTKSWMSGNVSVRKKIVAGNWKMNGLRVEARNLLESIKQGATAFSAIDLVIFPSFVHLQQTEELLADSIIAWGGQNLYLGTAGAFTGEVSGPMLTEYGCHFVLVGHSERRTVFQESLELITAKFIAAQQSRLQPVLCVGETLEQRQQEKTQQIIQQQLASVIEAVSIDAFRQVVIAYEPVWAIGTGLTATPQQAQEIHAFIRSLLAHYSAQVAQATRIIYGGSVKADNAGDLFAMPDIDGVLVGGASLEAKTFLAICQAAI